MAFLYALGIFYVATYAILSLTAWKASGRCQRCRNRPSCPSAGALLVCDEYTGAGYAGEEHTMPPQGFGISEPSR